MELRPGYKSTDLGVLPADWNVVPLGSIGEALIGLTYKPTDVARYGTLVLRSSNIQNEVLSFEDNVYVTCGIPDRIMVQPGDVLVCVRNGSRPLIGKTALLDERTRGMTFGAFMAVFRSDYGAFINYLFKSHLLKRQINEHLGATINQITNRSLRSFLVPMPPHANEVKQITDALSDVDALLDGLDRLIAKKRDIKRAAMRQLLTGNSRLPGFNEEWPTVRLGDHVSFLKTGSHSRADLGTDGPVHNLHYGDIHASAAVTISPSSLPTLRDDQCTRLDRLQDGDLVLADASEDRDGVGKSVEIDGSAGRDAVAGLHTIAARFDPEVLANGFKGYLQFCAPFADGLRRLAAGTKVYATMRSHVASIEMRLPSPDEQRAIARVFRDMDTEIDALERRRAKTHDLKIAMMQELLTGKTRLVGQDLPAAQEASTGDKKSSHNWAFNEAVVISTLVNRFGKEDYPLGRKRYTKLSYLLHRRVERRAEGYLKKAAGPYNPQTKYGGPEKIAKANGYILQHKGPKGHSGFIAADNIAQAEGYFEKWYGLDVLQWLEQFRFKKNDDLEVLATVDMATVELHEAGTEVNVASVKSVIANHPEWEAKLDRAAFSDANIAAAIEVCGELFSEAVH